MELLKPFQKYIKTHLYYLLSKKNVIFISILNILCLFYFLYISGIFDGIGSIDAKRDEYFNRFNNDYFFFLKIVYISFIIFISIGYFGREYAKYKELFIRDKKTKAFFYITKYISIILFNLFELLFLIFNYLFILALMPYGRFFISTFRAFSRLFLLGIFYLFFSSFFLLIFNTYLASIISMICYWFSFIYSQYYEKLTNGVKVLLLLFPFGESNNIEFIYGSFHVMIYTFLLILLNLFIIILRDDV